MLIGNHDTSRKTFIIAEIGNNHEGSFEQAKKMVDAARESEADAVKFQVFKTEQFINKDNEQRFQKLKSFELTYDEFNKLKEHADEIGIKFMATPFDMDSVAFLKDISCAYKIASSDNLFYPMIKYMAETNLPIIMSTGLIDIDDIKNTVEFIKKHSPNSNISSRLGILHCVSSYPVSPEMANLSMITRIRNEYSGPVGYSDHTLGIDACILSVAMGGKIIEKHFTLDKNYSDFRDHQLSADPSELKDLVSKVREAEVLLGSTDRGVSECESDMQVPMRRSTIVKNDIKVGAVLTLNDLAWVRPAGGFTPGEEEKIVGKSVTTNLSAGTVLTPEHLK